MRKVTEEVAEKIDAKAILIEILKDMLDIVENHYDSLLSWSDTASSEADTLELTISLQRRLSEEKQSGN